MRVKDTLNLGKTKFPMRGHLPQTEGKREQIWEENKVYEQRQKLNEGKPTFILHDGPPYANGDIHIGHAMNKISKDFIVRYKSMTGYRSPYVPGWEKLNIMMSLLRRPSLLNKLLMVKACWTRIPTWPFGRLPHGPSQLPKPLRLTRSLIMHRFNRMAAVASLLLLPACWKPLPKSWVGNTTMS